MKQLQFNYTNTEEILDNIGKDNLEIIVYEDGEVEIAAVGCTPLAPVAFRKPLALWYWLETLSDEYENEELKQYIKDTLQEEFNLCK